MIHSVGNTASLGTLLQSRVVAHELIWCLLINNEEWRDAMMVPAKHTYHILSIMIEKLVSWYNNTHLEGSNLLHGDRTLVLCAGHTECGS